MSEHATVTTNRLDRQPWASQDVCRAVLECLRLEDRSVAGSLLAELLAAGLSEPTAVPLVPAVADFARAPVPASAEHVVAVEPPAEPDGDGVPRLTAADRWVPEHLTDVALLDGHSSAAGGVRFELPVRVTSPAAVEQGRPERSPGPSPAGIGRPTVIVRVDQGDSLAAVGVAGFDPYDIPIPNKAPTAVNDAIEVGEDGSIVFDPTANDTDPDAGDKLWVKAIQRDTEHGRTFWEDGGYVRYIPNPNYQNTVGPVAKDTFTYTVTDGLATSTATVTVTVTSVNDAPVAANDAGIFVNTFYDNKMIPPETTILYAADAGYVRSLVANDRDYDGTSPLVTVATGDVVLVADDQGTPTVGTVTLSSSFEMSWAGPKGWVGETAFKYRSTDNEGAKSGWSWVKLIASLPGEGSGTVSAGADTLVVGDDPRDGNVMANDNGSFAVLNGQPMAGRLTTFGFDGAVEYVSDHTRAEPQFTYTVFNAKGRVRATAQVAVTAVNLTIWHGQYKEAQGGQPASEPVGELSEYAPFGAGSATVGGTELLPIFKPYGGFTVANLNNSDADADPYPGDASENDVPVNPSFAGSGEVDLMRLELSKPAAVAGQGTVTVSIASSTTPNTAPAVKLWKQATKGNNQLTMANWAGTLMAAIPVNEIPDALWLEFTGVSLNAADVTVTMTYNGASDRVSATGIWTKQHETATHKWPDGHFMNSNSAPGLRIVNGKRELPEDADGEPIVFRFTNHGRSLGVSELPNERVQRADGLWRVPNNVLSKFALLPSNLSPYSALGIISVDATRSRAHWYETYFPVGDPAFADIDDGGLPYWADVANDEHPNPDPISPDNDNDLFYQTGGSILPTNNVYYWDSPGVDGYRAAVDGAYVVQNGNETEITEQVTRQNFADFVRISIGQSWVPGPGVQGSRASVFFEWSNMQRVVEDPPAVNGGNYHLKRKNAADVTTENRLAQGHIWLNKAGGGV